MSVVKEHVGCAESVTVTQSFASTVAPAGLSIVTAYSWVTPPFHAAVDRRDQTTVTSAEPGRATTARPVTGPAGTATTT